MSTTSGFGQVFDPVEPTVRYPGVSENRRLRGRQITACNRRDRLSSPQRYNGKV